MSMSIEVALCVDVVERAVAVLELPTDQPATPNPAADDLEGPDSVSADAPGSQP
jgi:hypothetical protein